MNDELLRLTEADIQARCSEQSFARGWSYYASRTIKKHIRHETSLEAFVEGAQTYRVTVWVKANGEIGTHCNCPYYFSQHPLRFCRGLQPVGGGTGACNRWGGSHISGTSGSTCHFEWSVAE